ncbi:MAG: hypothetical protein JW741_11380, partial [Sedimentisphaerales bacterium]|nr:hypothetical protein [Sedimentisphaerales bacterium]
MNRRSFLRRLGSAGALLLAGNTAGARVLHLVRAGEPTKIANIEWFLYETEPLGAEKQPQRRCAVRITAAIGAQGCADLSDWMFPDDQTAGLINGLLLGRNAENTDEIWNSLYAEGIAMGPLSAVD